MRSRRSELRLVAVAAIAVAALVVIRSSNTPTLPRPAVPATWLGLVGDVHPRVSLGKEMIVVLRTPSVAQRLQGGQLASEADERRWSAEANAAQQQVLSGLAGHGFTIHPDFRFSRVLDGFSAALDPGAVALLEADPAVAGVYPVRATYPETIGSSVSSPLVGTGARIPGLAGQGVTIALLDTGVDLGHPYLGGRVEPGIDLVSGAQSASAVPNPQNPRELERHGTELAGLLVGSGGPSGAGGVAPQATVLPIRVAGWQPAANGRDIVYGRSDQLIAGLDRAVDPNGDGDTHDAVRIALIGVGEPYASFADSPEAQAVAGALALDVLVVEPAGNSGAAGPVYGSVAGPAGAPGALVVGALDTRPHTSTVRVVVREGLTVLLDARLPLLGTVASSRTADLPVAVPGRKGRLAGRIAVVAGGADPTVSIEAAIRAGASGVIAVGTEPPAGSLGLLTVPVVGMSRAGAQTIRSALARGATVQAAFGAASDGSNPDAGSVAPFSSRGLTFDGGLAPEISAPGIGITTSDPGSAGNGAPAFVTATGTSVAAATVAGVAALLFQERPGLSARDVASLLVGFAQPRGVSLLSGGNGEVDGGSSAVGEIAASQTALDLGSWTGRHWRVRRTFFLHNVSDRPLELRLSARSTMLAVRPGEILLRPGRRVRVTVTAGSSTRPPGAVVTGTIEISPHGSGALRIPWTLVVAPPAGPLISAAAISPRSFAPSDRHPAVLRVVAGGVGRPGAIAVDPVARLDLLLYDAAGRFVGLLATERDLLPGSYSFGITGRGPNGAPLAPGGYEIRLVAWPTTGGRPSRAKVPFRIQ